MNVTMVCDKLSVSVFNNKSVVSMSGINKDDVLDDILDHVPLLDILKQFDEEVIDEVYGEYKRRLQSN